MSSSTINLTIVVLIFIAILLFDDRLPFLETEWFQQYWTVSIFISMVYVIVVIHFGRRIRFNCNQAEFSKLWNFTLMIFSICGTYRNGREFLNKFSSNGFVATFCHRDYFNDRSVYFWYYLFVMSKAFEMGDTILLLARARPVRFIHWFHHVITLIYSFYIAAYLPAIGRWMSSMNFIVHSFMYGYYFLAVCGRRPSRRISILITSMQTLQMFIGLLIISLAYYHQPNCQNGGYTVEAGILMYISYVCLFTKLFFDEFKKISKKLN